MLPEHSDPEPPTEREPLVAVEPPVLDLSRPNFLHPLSILFEAGKLVRRFLIPTVLALLSVAKGGAWGFVVVLPILGIVVATTLVRYFTLRYRILGKDFIVTQGLLFRRVRSVPIRRIQNVDLVQNVFHRLLGVAEVRLETASGKEPEATLSVLTNKQIAELRHAILNAQRVVPAVEPAENSAVPPLPGTLTHAASNAPGAMPVLHGDQPLNHISTGQLFLAGLASNRGAVLLGIVLGLLFQQGAPWNPIGDERDWVRGAVRFNFQHVQQLLPNLDNRFGYAILASLGLLLLLVCLRIFSISWYLLRFYDHRLWLRGDELHITCGLFTRVSATIPRKRIQFISVHRSWLMRWMRLASIRVETAGGAGKQAEDAAATVSRRWFLPVVAESEVSRLLSVLRPGIVCEEAQLEWKAVSPMAFRRLLRVALLASILISLVGWFAIPPWGFAPGLVGLPAFAWLAYKKSRSMRYARTPWGVVYRSGVFTKKLSLAFYDRIQTVSFQQSPFDRRWNMASLVIDTAAAGPADHVIDVGYLDFGFARNQFEELQFATARQHPAAC